MLVFNGTIIHSTWEEDVVIKENMVLGVQDTKIIFVCTSDNLEDLKSEYGFTDEQVISLTAGEFLIPGLIDTHIHAAQYGTAGTGLDLQLLDWMDKYKYPTEDRFNDRSYAQKVSHKLVTRLLKNGTTTACYMTTSSIQSSLTLCRILKNRGQRAFVGMTSMNQNAPTNVLKTTEECLRDVKRYIKEVKALKHQLVQPALSPPAGLACDKELLTMLACTAEEYQLLILSHISENKLANAKILEVHPCATNYTDLYKQTGILNHRSLLGHGIYLSDEELNVLKHTRTAISHCPNSNISLCSGLCDVRRLIEHGITVGLGTDVSAGYQCSMLDAIRLTTHTSNMLSLNKGSDYKRVDYKEAFKLATLGGSKAIGMDHKIGNFEVGKEFDAVRVNVLAPDSPIDVFDEDTIEDIFQKFIYLGDDRNIQEVFVAGASIWKRL